MDYKIYSLEEILEILKEKGYKDLKILKNITEASKKLTGVFIDSKGRKYLIKFADYRKKKQLNNEIIFYHSIKPLLQKNNFFKTPSLKSYYISENYSILVETYFQNSYKIKGLESQFSSYLAKILQTIHNTDLSPVNLNKKDFEWQKILHLFDYYSKELYEYRKYQEEYYLYLNQIKNFKLTYGLTHNDFNGNNILYDRDTKKLTIIDWERWNYSPIAYDISRASVFASLFLSIKNNKEIFPFETDIFNKLYDTLNYQDKKIVWIHLILDIVRRIRYYETEYFYSKDFSKVIELSKKYISAIFKKVKNDTKNLFLLH